MSLEIKYYVRGKFSGTFSTGQALPLNAGDRLPTDEKHALKIHRGVITESFRTSKTDYEQAAETYHFRNIPNIQINHSADWPVPNDRIFSLGDMKLTKVQFERVEVINNRTYGEITGDIIASACEQKINIDRSLFEGGRVEQDPLTTHSDDPNRSYPVRKPTGPVEEWLSKNAGCEPDLLKWLRWLVLFLFLAWFISSCTKFGSNLLCRYNGWKYKREKEQAKREADTTENRLARIRPVIPPCRIDSFNGNNTPEIRWYNIGKSTGDVVVLYNMFGVADYLEVYYDGALMGKTDGFVRYGGNPPSEDPGTISFPYTYDPKRPSLLTVRVIPNLNDPTTKWRLDINCPQ